MKLIVIALYLLLAVVFIIGLEMHFRFPKPVQFDLEK